MNPEDTIAAISSAVGAAARMIVRLSGPQALGLTANLSKLDADRLRGGAALRVRLQFADLSVPATVYIFRSPRSYTGDDLVEFHIPGNPLLARMLLDHLHRGGARPAEPGEFTAHAFFNGRLDLTEAEGVAATIAAGNEQELVAARQLLAGELARRLRPAMDLLAETLALVEAGIDFADEEGVSFLSPQQLASRVADADAMLRRLLDDSTRFERLAHEPMAVLVGRPNAGKSTLLNALAGQERAVTSPVAGTTRDALSAQVALPRGILRIVDVAGVDDGDAVGDIDRQMRDRALRAVETADVLLRVHDLTDRRQPLALARGPDLTILTKSDLVESRPADRDVIAVSALNGSKLDELRALLDRLAFGTAEAAGGATLALNARHVEAVHEARGALARAAGTADHASAEVLALELREALDALGRVLGAVTPDDLLGRIFSSFCIGK
jgi:tRNA modification GTPase